MDRMAVASAIMTACLFSLASAARAQDSVGDAIAELESAASQPASYAQGRPFTAEQASCPETVIFFLMRKARLATGGSALEIGDELDKWRAVAQDRKRKVDATWLSPAKFSRGRAVYGDYLKEAADALRKRGSTDALRKHNATVAQDKLRAAARAWRDPLLRDFLQALVEMMGHKGNLPRAEELLAKCIAAAPHVAAFHQCRSIVLQAMNRPLDALEEAILVVHLQSDSRDAVWMLAQAVKNTPGSDIKSTPYLRAKAVLQAYDPKSITSSGTYSSPINKPLLAFPVRNLLMPGKGWSGGYNAILPTPPYDRLVFRQAVAVPVAANRLLVDEKAVDGALEVMLQLPDGRFVPATRRGTSFSGGGSANRPPLTVLQVNDVTFTPLTGDKTTKPDASAPASLYLAESYREMGAGMSTVKAKLALDKDELAMKTRLLPGQASAPLVTRDGVLAGFAMAKTDIAADDGGPDTFIPLKDLAALLEASRKYSSGGMSYSPLKRTLKPREVKGHAFLVQIIAAEGPEK